MGEVIGMIDALLRFAVRMLAKFVTLIVLGGGLFVALNTIG